MTTMTVHTAGTMALLSTIETGVQINPLQAMTKVMFTSPAPTWETLCQGLGTIWKMIHNTFQSMVW